VRLVAEHSLQYDPRELEGFLPQLAPAPPRRREPLAVPEAPPALAAPPIPLTGPALAVWNGEDVKPTAEGEPDRSASLVRIARMLHRAGLAPEHIALVLAERDVSLGWNKYAERKDAGEQYRRIVTVVEQGTDHRVRRPEKRPAAGGAE
jgi:hypothetical protein